MWGRWGGGGVLSKNNAMIGGAHIKTALITGGHNFHFLSCAFALICKNNSTCIVKQEMYSQCSMFLEGMKFTLKNIFTF